MIKKINKHRAEERIAQSVNVESTKVKQTTPEEVQRIETWYGRVMEIPLDEKKRMVTNRLNMIDQWLKIHRRHGTKMTGASKSLQLSVAKLGRLMSKMDEIEIDPKDEEWTYLKELSDQAMIDMQKSGERGWETNEPEVLTKKEHQELMGPKVYSRRKKGWLLDIEYREEEDGRIIPVEIARYFNPFQLLPNVKEFSIGESFVDPLFAKFGIKKNVRLKPMYVEYSNKSANRYLEHQIRRLNKSRNKPDLYWRIGWQLLKKSNTYLVLGINHVFNQWHRKLPLHVLYGYIREYKEIITKGMTEIDFKRVYIPKPSGKLRPLGVPKGSWRIYLYLLNQLLVIYLQDYYPRNQHGFWPTRSTVTAWKTVFKEALEAPDIMEYDLKSFFDTVQIQYVSEILRSYKVPEEMVYHLENLGRSNPKFEETEGKEDPMVEKKKEVIWLKSMLEASEDPHIDESRKKDAWYQPIREFKEANGEEILHEFVREGLEMPNWMPVTLFHELKFAELQWSILASLETETLDARAGGPPSHPDISYAWVKKNTWKRYSKKTGEPMDPPGKFYMSTGSDAEITGKATPFHDVFSGEPQGSPTSPLLSSLALSKELFERIPEILFSSSAPGSSGSWMFALAYADDFITYGKGIPEKISFSEKSGIKVNEDKSGWVKKNGEWLKELKFLGFVYNPWKDEFRASTRKGAELVYDKEALLRADYLRDLDPERNLFDYIRDSYHETRQRKWEDFIKSKLIGFITSRMYQDSWNMKSFVQDFSYTFCKNSWSDRRRRREIQLKPLDIFNSSSIASQSLLNMLKGRWRYCASKGTAT